VYPWLNPNQIALGMSDGAVHVLEPLEDWSAGEVTCWSAVQNKCGCRLDGTVYVVGLWLRTDSVNYSACLLDIQWFLPKQFPCCPQHQLHHPIEAWADGLLKFVKSLIAQ
jgi:hypothetical protein